MKSRILATCAFIIGPLLLHAIARADTFDAGMESLLFGDASQAAKLWTEAAAQGDSKAQHYLGLLYFHGRGVEKDAGKAEELWNQAAKNGNADSWYALYVLYINSKPAPNHLGKVVDYLVFAAKAGNKNAQRDLGLAHLLLSAQQPLSKLDDEALWSGLKESPEEIELRLGKKIYDQSCKACHESGMAGSPRARNKKDWEERMKQGFDVLVTHAIKGFTGKSGAPMPPKGGNLSLKDEEITAAVRYMTMF